MTQWDKISTGVSRNPWTPTVKISSHRADFSYFCAFEFFRLNVDHVLRRFILDLREPIMGLRGGILGRRVDLGLLILISVPKEQDLGLRSLRRYLCTYGHTDGRKFTPASLVPIIAYTSARVNFFPLSLMDWLRASDLSPPLPIVSGRDSSPAI